VKPWQSERSDATAYARWLDDANPAVVANALICLIHQTNYLLDQQIRALERDFISEGGYSEQLAAARIAERREQDRADQSDPSDQAPLPKCPLCGKLMVVRTARRGPRAGSKFLGCSGFPGCKGTRALEESD
jgi:four helix bundle suffix protein